MLSAFWSGDWSAIFLLGCAYWAQESYGYANEARTELVIGAVQVGTLYCYYLLLPK